MGRLPNHLWRRAVELFLLAGRGGNDGALPPVEEMVWILWLEKDKLLEELHDLVEIGVVRKTQPGKWLVTNYSKRQAVIPSCWRRDWFRVETAAGRWSPGCAPRSSSRHGWFIRRRRSCGINPHFPELSSFVPRFNSSAKYGRMPPYTRILHHYSLLSALFSLLSPLTPAFVPPFVSEEQMPSHHTIRLPRPLCGISDILQRGRDL